MDHHQNLLSKFNGGSLQDEEHTAQKDPLSIHAKKDEYLRVMKTTERRMILQKRRYNLITNDNNSNKITDVAFLRNLLNDLKSEDSHASYTALVSIRVTSESDLSFLDNFDGANELISLILRLCEQKDNLTVQSEAVKIITNLSAGDHTLSQKLIELNFIDLALKSFDSFAPEIADQILLALGNIISESVFARDTILNAGITDVLVSYIEQFNSRNGIWAFCNMFRGRPAPALDFCNKYFPFLIKRVTGIENQQDIEIAEDCLWTFFELTEEETINAFMLQNENYLLCLLQVLGCGKLSLVTPVLKILANLLVNSPTISLNLMKEGLAGKMLELLSLKNLQVKKEACTLLSTLVSENRPVIDIFIQSGLISKLVYMINADNKEIMKEACWIICKICRAASTEQIINLNQLKVLETVCDTLTDRESVILVIALDIIYEFLAHGQTLLDEDGENYFGIVLDSIGAISKLEHLQNSPSKLVEKKVVHILRKFFDVEEV